MAGRPKLFDEQKVINQATELFWTNGYTSASTEELLKVMNMGKGSFYLAFKGGKRELFEKSLQQFSDQAILRFNTAAQKSSSKVDFLRNFFLALAHSPNERKAKGCYLGNAIVELAIIDIDLKNKASDLLAGLENNFMQIVETAQKKGEIKNKTSPKIIAKYLINLWNGLHITLRLSPNSKTIEKIIELNLKILA